MENLTQEERTKIAIEELNKEPVGTIGQVALIKLANIGIDSGASNVEQTTNCELNKKRYNCKMVVTWEEK